MSNVEKPTNAKSTRGFTLIELLVVIGIISLLAALLLPVLAKAKQRATLANCLNNQKQLCLCMNMYCNDHDDKFPPYANGGGFWDPGTAPWESDSDKQQALVDVESYLRDATRNPLAPYSANPDVYHCPGDTRQNNPLGSGPGKGWAYDSYSKTQNITGDHHGSANDYYGIQSAGGVGDPTCTALAAVRVASQTFVWMEDCDDRGYNNGSWTVNWNRNTSPDSFKWVDPPAVYHINVGTFGFVDGHVESHKWLDPVILQYGREVAKGNQNPSTTYLESNGVKHSGPDYEYIRTSYRFPGYQ